MNNMCDRKPWPDNMHAGNYYQPASNVALFPTSYDQQILENSTMQSTSPKLTSGNMMMPSQTGSYTSTHYNSGMNTTSGTNTRTLSLQPETLTNIDFLPAYLSQHIGKWIRADFLIGGSIEQRVGILYEVGASYIILQAIEPATLVVCDMYSIKFVTIVLDGDYPKLMLV